MSVAAHAVQRLPDERALTDHNVIELVLRHPGNIVANLFSVSREAETGADWEWWILDLESCVGLLVQAKKMSGRFEQAQYVQLPHEYASGERQIERLLRTPSPAAPVNP